MWFVAGSPMIMEVFTVTQDSQCRFCIIRLSIFYHDGVGSSHLWTTVLASLG